MKRLNLADPIGIKGEDIACKYLEKKGYRIVCRNYLKRWGEIDIVAQKDKKLYFVEVKTVSREINLSYPKNVPRVTEDEYRPEENIHEWKLKRLGRVVQSYLLEKYEDDEPEWEFLVAIVLLDMKKKIANVKLLDDIVL
ncbi:MAG: YraN family protein [Candidatus Pacebacteria bacterium]|nr:YraN family protein [Candidatus Paceibacterota bacterium]MDD5356798.1 YraN family protein [Candidatus Paceibacterota bacterium]